MKGTRNMTEITDKDIHLKVADEALHAAFRDIQTRLGAETGDFAQAWVEPVVAWLAEYVKAEQAHLLTDITKPKASFTEAGIYHPPITKATPKRS
jgi:hypothetical protein